MNETQKELNYQAVGVVEGTLDLERQTLKTPDDREWSVSTLHRLKRSLEGADERQIKAYWVVYPRVRKVDDGKRLTFSLVKRVDDAEQLETKIRRFAIRGEIVHLDKASGRMIVEIRRNVRKPKDAPFNAQWIPNKLLVWASDRDESGEIVVNREILSELRVGQMIAADCKLCGFRLIMRSVEITTERAPEWVLKSRVRQKSF